MKRTYIKPETEEIVCEPISILAASPDPKDNSDTEHNSQYGDGSKDPIGKDEPDPNGAKGYFGFDLSDWESDLEY